MVSWSKILVGMWMGLFLYAATDERVDAFLWEKTGPKPYNQVKPIMENRANGGYLVVTSFVKNNACTLKSFRVVGIWEDVVSYLSFNDLDGLPEDYDRESGKQTLRIMIKIPEGESPDRIEIRTRHDCGGPILVNRVFQTIDL